MSFDDSQNNVIYSENGNYKVTAYGDVVFGNDETQYPLSDGVIEVGNDGRPTEPVLVLSSRGGNKIGAIQNVRSINVTHPLSEVAELSFDVYKEINGESYKDWDKIKDFKFIQMPHDNNWFEAKVTIDEENDIVKHVTCVHANEAELGQLNLYEVEINTDADIERDDYVETFFYNEEDPKASLLHRILKDKAPHYQIYHVDDSLKGLWRSFSFNGVSIQDALNQVAEEVGCLFVYGEWSENDGKYHRTISAYDLEDYCNHCGKRGNYTEHICTNCGSDNIKYGYGEDTGIFISRENLATSINYESNTDDVKNCFRLVAGDDVMTAAIKSCNPSMSQYMWYFSDDMLEDMSDELRSKITEYQNKVGEYQTSKPIKIDESYIDNYNALVEKYNAYNEDLVEIDYPITGTTKLTEAYYNAVNLYGFIKSELMPSSEKVESTTALEQLEILQADGNMSEVGISNASGTIPYTSANSAIQSYAKVYIDTSRYKVTVFTNDIVGTEWTGTITIQSYTDDEDTASDTFTITLFDSTDNTKYTDWVHQSVQKAMANREVTDLSVTNLFKKDESVESFKEKIKSYSLDYLDIMNDMATSAITVMTEQGIANEDSLDTDVYTQLYKPYLDKSRAIQAEIGIKEEELSKLQRPVDEDGNTDPRYPELGLIDVIVSKQNELSKLLDIQTYLGDDLWTELSFYRRENEYQNANYISDGLTDSEIIEQAQRFIESATKEIIKSSTLQHSISAPLIDFLIMPEFMKLQKKFKTGNWIRLMVDGKVYKLRLTNWTVDFDNIEDLDVEFSDVIRVGNTVSDIASILSKSRSMATTYDYTAKQANKGKDANDTIKVYKDYGLDFRKIKAITSKGNTNIVYDDDGILLKRVDGAETLPEQARIYNNGIYITKDAWETVSTGLGHYSYVDPETGQTVETYGIIADTVIGKLILGENLKIYSESGKFEIGDGGLKITAKDGEDNSDLFVIQKEKVDGQGRKYVEKYVYVDSNGDVKISGSSIVLGGKPLIEYIDEAIDDAEIDVSLPVTIQLDSSAGVIFRSKSISTNLTATVFKGGSDITSQITNFKWTKKDKYGVIDTSWTRETSSNTIAVSIDDIGGKVILVCEVSVTQDSVTTVSQGSITITEVQDGADGVSPTVRSIICSHSAAVCEKDGVYNPDTIKFSGQALSDNNISDYEGWFVIELSSDSQNWVSNYSSSSKESFVNYKIPLGVNINKDGVLYYQGTAVTTNGAIISSDFTITSDGVITTTQGVGFIIRSIRCSLYSDSAKTNLIDQQRVNIAFDGVDGDKGDDGYTVILTNENHTFAGNTTSAVDGGFTECEVIAYRGAVRVPCHIGSITGCPVGMNTPVITNNDTNNAKFTISVTSLMTSQNGTLNIPVTVDDKLFNMKFTYSLKLNGLDSVGLGWMINHSTPTVSNDGECIYYGFDDVTKEPSFTSDGWVLWNGQKVVIPHGCYINPDQTMPYNTTIYSVYRLPSSTTYTNGTFHDVAWVESTNSWRSNTYNGNTPTVDTSSWVWNEDTDIILAMYVEPSNEGAITNAQLFTPPKKYSELVEVAKGMAKDARKVATNYLSADSSGIMIADLRNGEQSPSDQNLTGRNVFINNEGVDIRDGTESLANFSDTVRIGKIVYDRPYATVDNHGMNILISRGADTRKLISLGALYGTNMNENMGHRIHSSFTYTLLNEPSTGSNISLALVYQTANPSPTIINCFTQGVATSRTSTTAPSVILRYIDIDGTSYPCGYLDYDGDRTFTYVANNPIYHEEPTGEIVDGEEEYAEVVTEWTSFLTPTVFYSTGDTTSGGYITNGTRPYNAPIGENTLTNGTELIASSRDQIVVGRYNESDGGDENAIIVGDGNSGQRHNSFTVGRGGNVFAAGDLDVVGNIAQNGTAVSLYGHSHNASAITTGTLPIERGGSGNNKTYSTATISNVCTAASGWSVTQAQYCSWGKVATIHIVCKKNSTAASAGYQTICTLVEGKRPNFSSPALKGWHDGAIVNTDGTIQFSDSVAANEEIQIRATYVLA